MPRAVGLGKPWALEAVGPGQLSSSLPKPVGSLLALLVFLSQTFLQALGI